ncbi:MAG: hypothetical protein ACI4OJ_06915 [Lachnospiraceae bacterium]
MVRLFLVIPTVVMSMVVETMSVPTAMLMRMTPAAILSLAAVMVLCAPAGFCAKELSAPSAL